MPNRLAKELSPYLRQHSNNPVDWYPWGEEAFEKAKMEDKPVLLSIGYSSCHWCHVMERESFEDPAVARIMNENFVNIKVDREERPDIDAAYMEAVQRLTGSGGWPLTVFLTPHGKPFFGGTYFPPSSRAGLPSFTQVLTQVNEAYHVKRSEIEEAAKSIQEAVNSKVSYDVAAPAEETIQSAYVQLAEIYDPTNGGFGSAPKFPQATSLEFLLRIQRQKGYSYAAKMVEQTLTKMAFGGIYDHVGGGFHRYAVDSAWLVPHFEKMLYDNALLSRTYLHSFQINRSNFFKKIVEETLAYVSREMIHPSGGFYSAQDADSEGEEGKFYLWRKAEIKNILGEERSEFFCKHFNVTEEGNFEGSNILHLSSLPEFTAAKLNTTLSNLQEIVSSGSRRLLEERNARVKPNVDDKVMTSWNGLMLASFAEAYAVLRREEYREVAEANASFLLRNLRVGDGLLHVWRDGDTRGEGYLEDYSFLADGLIALYQATFEPKWLGEAFGLAEKMLALFEDKENGGFHDVTKDREPLYANPKSIFDASIPSPSSMATSTLLKLHAYSGEKRFLDAATRALKSICVLFERYPTGFGNWLCALHSYLYPPKEVAIIGDSASQEVQDMLTILYETYRPDAILALQPPNIDHSNVIPLLRGKVQLDNKPTVYVCRNFACDKPTDQLEALRTSLS